MAELGRIAARVAVLGAACALCSSVAAAQVEAGEPGDAGPLLVPPALIADSPARPVGIAGDVELAVTIDEEGEVFEARVTHSDDPRLSVSALDAVGGLRFTPATVDGKPVPVEIGFRYHFVAPPPPAPKALVRGDVVSRGNRKPIPGAEVACGEAHTVTDESGRFALAVHPGAQTILVRAAGFEPRSYTEKLDRDQELSVRYRLTPASAAPFETIVRTESERTELSRITLQGSEVHDVAGTFGDPLRAVMLLPGVGSLMSGIAYPVVRGSDPADTGYYLDGISLPILFHLYLGPEVISPDFVDQVDFYPSNPPADEGRHLTGAVSVISKQAREKGIHASAYVDALNAGGFVEAVIPWTGTSIAAAGRVSYSGLLAQVIANALLPPDAPRIVLNFSDYQARVDQALWGGRLRLFVFGSSDTAGTEATATEPSNIASIDFIRADVRYQHPLWKGLGEVGFTYGDDSVGFTNNPQVALSNRQFRLRASWKGDLTGSLHLLVGADVDEQHADLSSSSVSFLDQGFLGIGSADASFSGVFGELTWNIGERWSLTPALRIDNYYRAPGIDDLALEPRLTARFRVLPNLTLRAGAALAHEPPVLLVSLPAVDLGALGHGLQEGLETEVGMAWDFFRGNLLDVTAYFDPLFRTVELGFPGALAFEGSPNAQELPLNPSTRGYAFGLELMLRHPLGGNWFGWLSYALAFSLRNQTYALLDSQGNLTGVTSAYLPFAFDETHIANAALTYRFPHGWAAGFVAHFNSGRPESGVLGSYTQRRGVGPNGQAAWIPVQLNQVDRLPPFFRIDLRASKTFTFDQFELEVYFDFLNATISFETIGYQYLASQNPELPPGSPGSTELSKTATSVPIVVPMLGLRASY